MSTPVENLPAKPLTLVFRLKQNAKSRDAEQTCVAAVADQKYSAEAKSAADAKGFAEAKASTTGGQWTLVGALTADMKTLHDAVAGLPTLGEKLVANISDYKQIEANIFNNNKQIESLISFRNSLEDKFKKSKSEICVKLAQEYQGSLSGISKELTYLREFAMKIGNEHMGILQNITDIKNSVGSLVTMLSDIQTRTRTHLDMLFHSDPDKSEELHGEIMEDCQEIAQWTKQMLNKVKSLPEDCMIAETHRLKTNLENLQRSAGGLLRSDNEEVEAIARNEAVQATAEVVRPKSK